MPFGARRGIPSAVETAHTSNCPAVVNAQCAARDPVQHDPQPPTDDIGNVVPYTASTRSSHLIEEESDGIDMEEESDGIGGESDGVEEEGDGTGLDETPDLPPEPAILDLPGTPAALSFPPALEHVIMSTSTCPRCTMCNLPGMTTCSGCRSCRYCSVECRDRDWPTHKLLCHSFKDFLTPPLSKARKVSFKRAVLFHADAVRPQFVWLKCTWNSRGYDDDHAGGLLGDDHAMEARSLVQKNLVREKELDHSIDIVHRDAFGIDGSSINQSILAATQDKMAYHWAGNIVAVRREGLGRDPRDVGNMSMEDFRHAVDFFLTYTGTQGRADFKIHPASTKVIWTPSSSYGVTILADYGTGASGSHGFS